ncbi:MAG: hypothetical protein J6V88_00670 [Kiritimatiellae bacterium]|nr:hypothetical protein [Kiritimatiellia bacterium]
MKTKLAYYTLISGKTQEGKLKKLIQAFFTISFFQCSASFFGILLYTLLREGKYGRRAERKIA